MAAGINQKKQSPPEEIAEEPKEKKPSPSKKNWLYESLDLSRWVHYQTIIRNLPFVFFIAAVAIIYIANAHYAEKNVRELNLIERKMNEMRWEYMTTKSELENISKQSEVAKLVELSGLKELREPPKKIIVKEDEH
ncbi:MAG: FtsL-like putative cell division protein [Chitinophagales bacterium]